MPIVQGNEPQRPGRRAGGSVLGWLLPLIIFGPTLYRIIRSTVGGRVTDQQLALALGGIVALVVVVTVVRRVNGTRDRNVTRLPTGVAPPMSAGPRLESPRLPSSTLGAGGLPRAPRFEPMVTGKVIVAGFVLAALLGAAGFVLLMLG